MTIHNGSANQDVNPAETIGDWHSKLKRRKDGSPTPSLTNCLIAMRESGKFYSERRKSEGGVWAGCFYSVVVTPFTAPSEYMDCGFGMGPFPFSKSKSFLVHLRHWLESEHDIYPSAATIKEAVLFSVANDWPTTVVEKEGA